MKNPIQQSILGFVNGILLLFFLGNANAQSNNCGGAPSLTSAASCTNTGFTMYNGNSGNGSSSCVSGINDDAWYQFTATGTTSTIDLSGGSNNLAAVIYSGTCAGLTEIGCDDQGTSSASAAAATVIGNTYYVRIIRTNGGGGSTTGNICITAPVVGANMVVNGDFTGGLASWSGCGNSEIMATSQWHGGVSPYTPNSFAEIDAHLDMVTGTADDMVICQTIPGFTVGNTYQICMDVQRRPGPSACTTTYNQPGTVTMTTTIDGGALSVNTSQSNTTWGWTTVCYNFTATLPTQLLMMTPNDNSTCGMLVTNITVSPIILLPIELVSFDAEPNGSQVDLSWVTNVERDNDYFTIERSQDANNWSEISKTNGAGNSQIPLDYESIDTAPLEGVSYYRLKQTDFNGVYSYSKIVSINRGTSLSYVLYPNPTKDVIHLTNNDMEDCEVQVVNLLGEEVSQISVQKSTTVDIPLPHQKGTYLVRVTIGDVVTITKVEKL